LRHRLLLRLLPLDLCPWRLRCPLPRPPPTHRHLPRLSCTATLAVRKAQTLVARLHCG
jgi:hypothetical protein